MACIFVSSACFVCRLTTESFRAKPTNGNASITLILISNNSNNNVVISSAVLCFEHDAGACELAATDPVIGAQRTAHMVVMHSAMVIRSVLQRVLWPQ